MVVWMGLEGTDNVLRWFTVVYYLSLVIQATLSIVIMGLAIVIMGKKGVFEVEMMLFNGSLDGFRGY